MAPSWVDPAGWGLMKRDTFDRAVERAHLKAPGDSSHVLHRYAPSPELADLVRGFWVPVWSVPAGTEAPQRVLRYPVCLLVVASDYARFYGVASGVSTTVLSGQGWAVGVLCAPATGWLLTQRSLVEHTDRFVGLEEVLPGVTGRVRAAMTADPTSEAAHSAAIRVHEEALRRFLPVDEEGVLVNRIVDLVEGDPDLLRVGELSERVGLSERSLQRLTRRRLGLSPKWLVQRRRLQEAADRLRSGGTTAARIAADLDYADQAHFTRDFARVTGTTPARFAAEHAAGRVTTTS
jgi:AraC-like DNA-binding protein